MADVKEILELWFKLRETKKDYLPVWELSRNNPWTYEIKRDMEEAFKLDPEGLTALLILDNFRYDFFSCCGISIKDILENQNFDTFIADCRHLTAMLSEEEIVNALSAFIGSVFNALKIIGVEREDVDKMVSDRYEMAILRRDALRSMEVLNLHQFFQGDTKTDHLTFLSDIHVFWNMNSLIRCAWQSEDGVSINLIKDPLDTSSYFAFVAKNGGNLTVLTDKPKEAHPLSKYMSRRPEKEFTNRVFRNHFPYGLLDLHYDHKGYLHPGKTSLVPLQEKPIKIGSISTMTPDEIIWTIMMFSLIDAKLYKENYHCAELSYTSDMIEDPGIANTLIEAAGTGGLMVRGYKPLVAPVLTAKTIEEDDQYVKYPGTGMNLWLYERYKDQIPEELLNGLIPNDESALFLLPDSTVFLAPKERVDRTWYNQEPELLKAPEDIPGYVREDGVRIITGSSRVEGAIELKKMTGDEFGTAESLMEDYRWFARYNIAKFINKKAQEEFKAHEKEVVSWVRARVEQNLERICKDIIRAHLMGEKQEQHPCRFTFVEMKGNWWEKVSGNGTMKFAKDRKATGRPGESNYAFYTNARTGCYFSEDAPCSYILKANAYYSEDLLYLTGCSSVEELPDVLRQWRGCYTADDYEGNCNLERTDPISWVAKNPWKKLEFNPMIGIGKKYFAKVKKELGL